MFRPSRKIDSGLNFIAEDAETAELLRRAAEKHGKRDVGVGFDEHGVGRRVITSITRDLGREWKLVDYIKSRRLRQPAQG